MNGIFDLRLTLGGIRSLEIYSSLGFYKFRIRTKPTPEA